MRTTVPLYGFGGGGGVSLNFKVVGNPQPENPADNTIWLKTDVPVTGYYFSPEQPEAMAEGQVWLQTEIPGIVKFNALKKNGIRLGLKCAMQYTSGGLVNVEALIYQNGTWIDWVTYLFKNGNEYTDLTGGWVSYAYGTYPCGDLVKDGSTIKFTSKTGVSYPGGGTANKISITGKKALHAKGYGTTNLNTAQKVGLFSTMDLKATPVLSVLTGTSSFDVTLDLTTVPAGSYYIGIYYGGYLTEMYLE